MEEEKELPYINHRRGLVTLSPLVVFFVVYVISSIAAGDFYKMPVAVAFLIASAWAFVVSKPKRLAQRVDRFSAGAAHRNIMMMLWIFILAGGFANRDSPGQGHTADGRRAPSASVHHTRPRGAGDAGRRGHGDRPAVGKTGDPTRARASAPERVGAAGGRSRELPLVQHATAAADRRRRNGQRIGTAAGPGSETHQGAAPGSGRRRAD